MAVARVNAGDLPLADGTAAASIDLVGPVGTGDRLLVHARVALEILEG